MLFHLLSQSVSQMLLAPTIGRPCWMLKLGITLCLMRSSQLLLLGLCPPLLLCLAVSINFFCTQCLPTHARKDEWEDVEELEKLGGFVRVKGQ